MQGFLQVQQAETLGAEAQVKKGVQERVEAAVDVGQAGGVRMGQQKKVEEGAGVGRQVEIRQGVHGLHDVEGHPAGGEHHYERGDDLEQAALALVPLAQAVEVTRDGAADEPVAHHHGQKRDEKAESCGGDAEACDPQRLLTRFAHDQAEVHGTGRAVGFDVVHRGAEEQRGCGQHPGQEPDGGQRCPHVHSGAQLRAGEGVHDGHVAIQAQAGEAEHAGVHVEQNHVAADLAEGDAKGPVVSQGGVHGPEGQRHHKGQISQSQVSYVDVRSSPLVLGSPHGEDDYAVTGEPQDEDEHVEDGNQRIRRLPFIEVAHGAVGRLLVVVLAVVAAHVVHSGPWFFQVLKSKTVDLNLQDLDKLLVMLSGLNVLSAD